MKKRESANDNQKAIKAVFGEKARLREIINQAIEQMEDSMDEDTSFEDALGQFCYDFNTLAAETAAVALGVDLTHYYIRTSSQMELGDMQRIIDEIEFKDFDRLVNKLLAALHKGDQTEAQALFTDILPKLKADFPRMTLADFKAYLVAVNGEMSGAQSIKNAIKNLSDFTAPDATTNEIAPVPGTRA